MAKNAGGRERRQRPNILITGTPGTGKTTTSAALAEATNLRHINVGDLVKEKNLHDGWDEEFDCYVINEDLVCDELEDLMEGGGNIVDHHGCDFFPERWFDCVVVLQTENSVLYDRLTKRGYTGKKLSNNIECEIFQVLLEEAKESYSDDIVVALKSDCIDDIEKNVSTLSEWVNPIPYVFPNNDIGTSEYNELKTGEICEDHQVSSSDFGAAQNIDLSQDVISTDYTDLFYTNEWFGAKDDLIGWVRNIGNTNNMVIIVQRSIGGGENKRGRVWLVCECSGEYRQFKGKQKQSEVDVLEEESGDKKKGEKKRTKTKKCSCPFLLKGVQVSIMGPWGLEIVNASHNHPLGMYLESHAYPGRLTKEEKYVIEMSKNKVRPQMMLAKAKFLGNKSTLKNIYNVHQKHKLTDRGGHSQLQHLMSKLKEYKYYYMYNRCEATGDVRDLFFSHPRSIDLLRAFPQVLLMDCTYKTNKYNMPLMEIVGVTSTEMTFCVGCAFMVSEKEDHYEWVLRTLRAVMDSASLPTVIVTDRELALMNAIETVFPEVTHFLCRWHINQNMLVKCKKHIKQKNKFDMCMFTWNMVILAETEEESKQMLQLFKQQVKGYPKVFDYGIKSWIEPYANRFLAHNTDNVKHYGNTTTNRAKSHHAALKRQLQTSMNNFETGWESFHTLMEATHVAIKASFEKSITNNEHRFRTDTYRCLRGLVSSTALRRIHDAISELKKGVETDRCNHYLRRVYGLPCHHELSEYISKCLPIPMESLDDYWRKLDFEPRTTGASKQEDLDKRWLELWMSINDQYHQADYTKREMLFRRHQEASNPR